MVHQDEIPQEGRRVKTPKVLVLMSTYNGERFLREQLDSILSQEGVEVSLRVRDDGSKDGTCRILSDYASEHGNIQWKACENVGFVRSFSALVRMAAESDGDADYFAFADQDDIWMPHKLATACKALAAKDSSRPCLFTSNSMQVDADGHELEPFHKGPEPRFRKGNVLVFGTEQGCSMVFNKKAVEIYAGHEPSLTWHDRWMYHICYFLGSVTYDHQPLFYYRRHEKNALANKKAGGLEGEPSKIKRVYRILFVEPPVTNHVEMAAEFYDCFASRLKKDDQKLFRRFIACRKSILSKIYMLASRHFIYPYYDANEGRLQKWLIIAGRL